MGRKIAFLARGAALAGSALAMLVGGSTAASAEPLGFAPRQFVDSELAGGEPFVLAPGSSIRSTSAPTTATR